MFHLHTLLQAHDRQMDITHGARVARLQEMIETELKVEDRNRAVRLKVSEMVADVFDPALTDGLPLDELIIGAVTTLAGMLHLMEPELDESAARKLGRIVRLLREGKLFH